MTPVVLSTITTGDTISFTYTEFDSSEYGYGEAGVWQDVPATAPVICKDGVLGVEVESCGTQFLALKDLKDIRISPAQV